VRGSGGLLLFLADLMAGFFAAISLFAGPLKTSDIVIRYSPFDFTVFSILLALTLGVVSQTARKSWKGYIRKYYNQVSFSILVLLLYCVLSYLLSPGRVEGLIKLRGLFGVGLGLMLIGTFAGERKRWIEGFFAGCTFLALYLLWVMKGGILGDQATYEIDMLENYLFIGHFFSVLAGVCLYGLTLVRERWASRLLYFFAILFSASVFMIAARGPFVSVILAWIIFIVWFIRRHGILLGGGRIIFGSCMILLVLYLMDPEKVELLFGRGLARFGVIVDTPDFGESASTRVFHLFPRAIEGFLSRPLFGIGFGSFGFLLGWGDVRAYPHNFVLEVLCELGIFGAGLWAWFIGSMVMVWHRFRALYRSVYCLAGSVGFMVLVQAMFSGDQADNRALLFVAGLLVGSVPIRKSKAKSGDLCHNVSQ